jgi:HEAT repeat protein
VLLTPFPSEILIESTLMKFFQSALVAGMILPRVFALEASEISAVSAKFNAPTGDEQYQARIDLNRLVDQATIPGKGDPAAVTKILVQAVQSPDTSLEAKKYLLRALCRVGTEDAVTGLTPLLSDKEPLIREETRFALASIASPKAVAALEAALPKASDPHDQIGLISSLGACKSETSVPLLAVLLIDADPGTAAAAINALAHIGGPKADAAMKQAWSSGKVQASLKPTLEEAILVASPSDLQGATVVYQKTDSDEARIAAFLLLLKSSPASAASTLIAGALKSPSLELRRVAIASGIQSESPAVQSAIVSGIAGMSKEERMVVLANAELLKPVELAEKTALGALASGGEDERVIALAALGSIATQPAFKAVLNAMGAREPAVNQAAANALSGMNYPAAEASLLSMLQGAPGPEKILAIKATTVRGLDGASEILLAIFKGTDEPSAKEAMKSLYFIADLEDLKKFCGEAVATTDAELKGKLVSLCKRIASRIKTAEAEAAVKPLG